MHEPRLKPRAAAIYARMSQDRTGAGLGVDRQEKECRALADRLGWTVADLFPDNDVSATDRRKKRPHYERMLQAIRDGKIDAIITWHTDRLTRQPRQLEDIIDLATEYGIGIAQVQGELDLTTPNGQTMARVIGAMSRQEVMQKSERQKARNRQTAQAGLPTGGPRPFGYEPGGLVLRQKEADAIADATKRVLAGSSLASIMREWNAAGLLTSRGGKWTYSSLTATLTRWRNAGIVQHQGETLDVKAQWEPIVSPEDLKAVRDLLSDPKRRTNNAGNATKHLLSGILQCGRCNASTMRWGRTTTRAGVPYDLYVCKECRSGILKDIAETAVLDYIAKRLADPSPAVQLLTATDRDSISQLRKQRATLNEDERQIRTAKISLTTQLAMLEDIESRRKKIDAEIGRLTQRDAMTGLMLDLTPWLADHKASIPKAAKARQEVRDRFQALDIFQKRTVVKTLCTVRVTEHQKGVRPSRESAASRVHITSLDPRTGEPSSEYRSAS